MTCWRLQQKHGQGAMHSRWALETGAPAMPCPLIHVSLVVSDRTCSGLVLSQDVVNSLLSSELVYKALDGSEESAVASFEEMRAGLPSSSATLQQVQWSLPHVSQRYAALYWMVRRADACRQGLNSQWSARHSDRGFLPLGAGPGRSQRNFAKKGAHS